MSMLKVTEVFSVGPVREPQFLQFHGTGTSVSFLLLDTRVLVQSFQEFICYLFHFCIGLVPFRYHFGFKSGGT